MSIRLSFDVDDEQVNNEANALKEQDDAYQNDSNDEDEKELLAPEDRLNWQVDLSDFSSRLKDKKEMKNMSAKAKLFYKHQNDLIGEYLWVQEKLNDVGAHHKKQDDDDDNDDEEDGSGDVDVERASAADGGAVVGENVRQSRPVRVAIYLSFAANVLLLALKLVAFIESGSLAVLASVLDSILDLLSGAIMFFTSWLMRKTERSRSLFPAGNRRIEPLGLIVFSAVMFTATLQLVIEAIQTLVSPDAAAVELGLLTLIAFGITIGLKATLWLYCRTVGKRHRSESVNALTLDHRNDVLTNGFGMAAAIMAVELWQPIDPIAAILLAIYIMYTWANTGYEQVKMMSGIAAPTGLLNTITFLARNHHSAVQAIDTVRAYHLSYDYIVEVDIVLPENMPLHEAHDIGEALQFKIERVPRVERAFVHLDWEFSHKPEH
jgi:cation diffusion facilitator family transporter